MLKEILPYVQRPSRYLGNEVNAVRKAPSAERTWVALAFPDLYEIGMSHLGLKILYHILNRRPEIAAERVFAPGQDYEARLRHRGESLRSLESSRPLSRFDIVGFSLQYELSYTNILNMLDLGGIPLKASRREEDAPLVIGGGPGAFNPEPLAAFFDLFVLGDGEEAILEIADLYRQWRASAAPKDVLLAELSRIRGVYIPSFFRPVRGEGGRLSRIEALRAGNPWVERRVLEDLEGAEFPTAPVVPFMQSVHDRVTLEVSRGCTRGCRFCQAGILYRPVRERSARRVIDLATTSLRNSGYEELSLSSLNVGEYSGLGFLVSELGAALEADRTSLSLPTLRLGALNSTLTEGIRRGRRTGFTLVPEAGTERLRKVINKEVSEEALFRDIEQLLRGGWVSFKLYFMIGLPTETTEDLEGIVSLCRRILRLPSNGKRLQRVAVNLSSFVPKAHTPFQWLPQEEEQSLRQKLQFFRERLRNRVFELRWQDPSMSFLEAVFSRGDRELGPVIEEAWRRGCKFDSWGDHFSFPLWREAFDAVGLDPAAYAYASPALTDVLPWDHLRPGVDKRYLEEEYRRSLAAQNTPDCRIEGCRGCGLQRSVRACRERGTGGPPSCSDPAWSCAVSSPRGDNPAPSDEGRPDEPKAGLRVVVQKMGPFKHLSHLEFGRAFARACRRAGVPLAYTRGHHPLPRISFGPALPVGIASEGEAVDVELRTPVAAGEVMARLNAHLPEGMQVTGCWERLGSLPRVPDAWRFEIVLVLDRCSPLRGRSRAFHEAAVAELLAREEILITKSKNGAARNVDVRPSLKDLRLSEVREGRVVFDLELDPAAGGSSLEAMIRTLYGLSPDEAVCLEITKRWPDAAREESLRF